MRERKQKKGEKKLSGNNWGVIGAAVVLTVSLVGAGFWYVGDSENKPSDEKTASEKEIENINPRDNVMDESEAFEGEIPSLKEKKRIKDAEKKKASSKKQEDVKGQEQIEKNEILGESTEIIDKPENIEKPGSSNKPENTDQQEGTEKPEVPEKPGDTEQPETPEQSKPEKPQLPQVQEPGWTIGVY